MAELFASWWMPIAGYFTTAASVFSGSLGPIPVLAALGIVCLVTGVALAIVWREAKAPHLLLPLLLASLTTVELKLADTMLSWMGVGFSIIAGAVILVLLVALIASDASRRLPIVLVGIFTFSFSAWSALVATAEIVATP